MPTFQSIPLDPAVRQRLQQDGIGTNKSGRGELSSVATPHAFLTRAPEYLLQHLSSSSADPMTMERVQEMRSQVAHAMLASNQRTPLDNRQNHALIPGVTQSLLSILEQEQKCNPSTFVTGCSELDQLLGLPSAWNYSSLLPNHDDDGTLDDKARSAKPLHGLSHHVWQISGPSSCGKTQLAIQIAAQAIQLQHQQQQQPRKVKVQYIISLAGHTPRTVAQRLHQLVLQNNDCDPESITEMLNQVTIVPIRNSQELKLVLAQIHQEQEQYQTNDRDDDSRNTLIIIDSINGILLPSNEQEVRTVGRKLKQLSRLFGLTILVTNSKSKQQVLTNVARFGPSWREAAIDGHLYLQPHVGNNPTNNGMCVKATMLQHPAKVCEDPKQVLEIDLELTERGFRKLDSSLKRRKVNSDDEDDDTME